MPEEGAEAPATTSPGTSPGRGQSPNTRTEPRLSNSTAQCTHMHNSTISVSQLNPVNHMSCQMRLREMGIVPLDIGSSPTGQLAHFLVNQQKVTQDRWILNTVKGYRISFLATPKPFQPGPAETGGTGDQGPAAVSQRGGDGAIDRTPRLFSLHPVSSPKKGWRSETGHQSEESQLLCGSSTFQNGGDSDHEKPPVSGGLAQS